MVEGGLEIPGQEEEEITKTMELMTPITDENVAPGRGPVLASRLEGSQQPDLVKISTTNQSMSAQVREK